VTIVLHSKNYCQPCAATKRRLVSNVSDFVEVNLDEGDEKVNASIRDELVAAGFQESPVVKVYDDGTEVDAWAGYRPDLIDKWTKDHERAA